LGETLVVVVIAIHGCSRSNYAMASSLVSGVGAMATTTVKWPSGLGAILVQADGVWAVAG